MSDANALPSASARIRTTVVGSYPVPEWLVAAPSEQALIDATRVVIATQEAAGVDVVCDGELYRFDINHPETNGMIEYFVRPMQGVRYEMTFDEVMAYRSLPGCASAPARPASSTARCRAGRSTCRSPASGRKALATHTFKFTVTGPHMLAKTLLDRHYADTPELAHAIADVLAEQVRAARRRRRPARRGEPARPPRGMGVGGVGDQPRARRGARRRRRCTCASATTAGRASSSGTWEKLMRYLNALHADHVVLECAHRPPDELAVFKDLKPEIGFGLGVIDIKATEVESADEVARAIERAEQTLGAGRVRYIHPDCGFWMLKRPIADAKIRALARGRDLFEGRAR